MVDDIIALGVKSELLSEGLEELGFVLDSLSDLPAGSIVADLSIARGLDYYTGTVYEGKFADWPNYGSICSGGRYENLAGSFIRRSLPGIGLSIGLTRIFAKLVSEELLQTGPSCPSDVLVVVPSADRRIHAIATATQLRRRGLNTELYHQADKLAKQIRYASRKGIPYVWFPHSRTASSTRSRTWPPASKSAPTRLPGNVRTEHRASGPAWKFVGVSA